VCSGRAAQVFCKTKSMCDQLATCLPTDLKSAALHGDKLQRERDYVLTAFKRVSAFVPAGGERGCSCPRSNGRAHLRKPLGKPLMPDPAQSSRGRSRNMM